MKSIRDIRRKTRKEEEEKSCALYATPIRAGTMLTLLKGTQYVYTCPYKLQYDQPEDQDGNPIKNVAIICGDILLVLKDSHKTLIDTSMLFNVNILHKNVACWITLFVDDEDPPVYKKIV